MNTYIVELERKEHYDNGYDDYRFRDEGSNMVVIGEERAVEILNEFWGELIAPPALQTFKFDLLP